jgi:hypothetical protein
VLELSAGNRETKSDAQGRFTFSEVPPGVQLMRTSKAGYETVTSSTEVVAGVKNPSPIKVQIKRLFDQDPFSEAFKMQGFLACGYSAVLITAPCITDYTSILSQCPGGCVPALRTIQGDRRDYTIEIGAGWQQIIWEMKWEASASGTSQYMGPTISYTNRTATHWFAQGTSTSPLRLQVDTGEVHPSNQQSTTSPYDPNMIPPEGIENLLVFVNLRAGDQLAAIAVNQQFEIFQHNFYYGVPKEDWSFIAGDPVPF